MFYFRLLSFVIFYTVSVFAQQIDSILINADPEFVFSNKPNTEKSTTITITCYDSNDQPVGANVPIAINVNHPLMKGATLFKTEYNADSSYNYFYFRTNGDGQVIIEYMPNKFLSDTYSNIRNNFLSWNPDASEEDVRNEYRKYFTSHMTFWSVKFSDANDEQTAYAYGNISYKKSSVFPVLYGYDAVGIDGPAKDGTPYIFTAENFKSDPVPISIQALDLFGNPLPAGSLLWIKCFWGRFYGDAILEKEEEGTFYYTSGDYNPSFQGGGDYLIKLGAEGKSRLMYQPPPTTMMPFTHWANTMLYYHNYDTREEAWKAYTGNDIAIPGSAVFYEIKGAAWNKNYPNGYETTIPSLKIDSTKGVVPALVGVDQIKIDTESDRDLYYVYASKRFSESAKITIQAFDGAGRPVPKGAPVGVTLSTRFPNGEFGSITGETVVAAAWAGTKERTYIVLMGEEGKAEVEYRAPFFDFNWDYYPGLDSDGLSYDDKYSGIYNFFPVPYYGWEGNWDTGNPPHWFVGYTFYNSSNPYVNLEYEGGSNIYPVLVGADHVKAWWIPPILYPFKYLSRLNIYIQDAFGNPAPKGSNIYLNAKSGTFENGTNSAEAVVYGKRGKASVTYFSPTRSAEHTWSYATVYVNDGGGFTLATKKIKLVGPAASWHDFNLSNWILGFDITEVIKDLNPLKVLGAIKEMADYANEVAQQQRELYEKIYNGTATDADFDAYEQKWRKYADSIIKMSQTVPNTSLTGPDLSAGELFNSLATNGLRHTLKNTLEEKFIKGPQKKVIQDFAVFHLSKFYPQSEAREGVLTKTAATYYYHSIKRMGKLELLTDLYTIPSESGMYEMYGYKFRLNDLDSVLINHAIELGDQWPINGFLIPARYAQAGYPEESVLVSHGFFEISDIDPVENYIEGTVVGYFFNDPEVSPVLAFSKKVKAAGDTLSDAFGTQLILPSSAAADSTHLFLVRTAAPLPLIEQDSVVIQFAQLVGSMAPDSTIQAINFNVPASLQIVDTSGVSATDPWRAYRFDDSNQKWVKISDARYINDTTFAITISNTGVYGVGRTGFKVNEYPVLSSFPDTTIVQNSILELPFNAYDPEGENLTFWTESNKTEVTVTILDTVLHVEPQEDWTGVVTISLFATDGQDTSVSSFHLNVVSLTAIENLENLPVKFALYQNYPNPFNSTTTIRFDVPRAENVKIEIFNMLGQKVRTLLNNQLLAGKYRLRWDGLNDQGLAVGSGIYFYVFRTRSFVRFKRMLLVK